MMNGYMHRRDLAKAKLLADKLADGGGTEETIFAAMIAASAASWDDVHKWA